MDLSRRALFGGLGLVFRSPEHETVPPDTTVYHGWNMCWSGWRELPMQAVRYGTWSAQRPPKDGYVYRTTLGSHGSVPSNGYVLNITVADGWPILTTLAEMNDPGLSDRLKARAFRALLEDLDDLDALGR